MVTPTLIVVSGPPGSGKTTLAHAIARAMPCPAICRDEIKDGLVHAAGIGDKSFDDDAVSRQAFGTFFDILRLLVTNGVTAVAEAAFQDKLWRPGLEPLLDLADIHVIHCVVDAALARQRIVRRLTEQASSRASHLDREFLRKLDRGELSLELFQPISITAPSICVDTTNGYNPNLDQIIGFINQR